MQKKSKLNVLGFTANLFRATWFSNKNSNTEIVDRNPKGLLITLGTLDNLFGDFSCYNKIKKEVQRSYKSASSRSTISRLLSTDLSLEVICLFALQEACERQLSSGQHHIKRGALNTDGHSIEGIFRKAVEELIKRNFCNPAEAEEKIREVELSIGYTG